MTVPETRAAELAANLDAVHARIATACYRAGRDPAGVSLVAVSKTFPASDVQHLLVRGQRDFGENRHQEAAPKAAQIPTARWHFLGQLQRNKAKAVATYAEVVESLDRIALLAPLDVAARDGDRLIDVLIQISLDEATGRGGARPVDVAALADAAARCENLRLRGVMAVAPRGPEPARSFARLREIAETLRQEHPAATVISAGMSSDLEDAVAQGATLVRVGAAVFGSRAPHLG